MQEGSCRADWFPEGKIDSVDATVSVEGNELRIAFADGTSKRLRLDQASVSDYLKGVPLKVAAAGDGLLSIPDGPVAQRIAKRGMPIGARVEKRLHLWLPGLLLGAVAVFALLAFVVVPRTAERVAPQVPQEWVVNLGDFAYEQIGSWIDVEPVGQEEEEAAEAIAQIGAELAAPLDDEGYEFRFLLDRTEDRVNAFALPNGTIIFTYDLYTELDRDQVAGVIAHEIAHVTERHGLEALLASSTWAALAAFLFPDPSIFVYLPVLAELSYSREAEHEADCEAAAILTRAGYPTAAAADALERLEEVVAAKLDEEGDENGDADPLWDIFSTHPNFPERTAHARQCAGLEG